MKVIGLTGGIGSGKSTVSEYLRAKGYLIVDADEISHKLTEKGTPTLAQIAATFGEKVLLPDGALDRKGLASIVFNDREKKAQLEGITTSAVVEIIEKRIHDLKKENQHSIIFIDAPLLFETGAQRLTDMVWLVDAELSVRVARVMERDQATLEEVMDRIQNQMDGEQKKRLSQEIIDNSKGKEALYLQIEQLLEKYA